MADLAPTATIDQLVINSPYEEAREHWRYHRETRLFTREPERRKAGYLRASESSRSFDASGIFVELPLVNQIRPRIKAWREADYPGAIGTTKRLLQHWHDPEQRDPNRRFFFCQLEAIGTLMWLTEAWGRCVAKFQPTFTRFWPSTTGRRAQHEPVKNPTLAKTSQGWGTLKSNMRVVIP